MQLTRRHFLQASLALAVSHAMPGLACAAVAFVPRRLHLYNTHTGESFRATYWERGVYISSELENINKVLRDHRTGDVHAIDPQLIDLLAALHGRLRSNKPFEVISGYRSPKSNAMLHRESSGVATHSMHMLGRAIDIRLTDRPLAALQKEALAMGKGGVGYYPASDFVHVDTGRVRRW